MEKLEAPKLNRRMDHKVSGGKKMREKKNKPRNPALGNKEGRMLGTGESEKVERGWREWLGSMVQSEKTELFSRGESRAGWAPQMKCKLPRPIRLCIPGESKINSIDYQNLEKHGFYQRVHHSCALGDPSSTIVPLQTRSVDSQSDKEN